MGFVRLLTSTIRASENRQGYERKHAAVAVYGPHVSAVVALFVAVLRSPNPEKAGSWARRNVRRIYRDAQSLKRRNRCRSGRREHASNRHKGGYVVTRQLDEHDCRI